LEIHQHFRPHRPDRPIGGSLTLVNPPTTADYGTLGSITSIVTTGSTNNTRTITVASTVGLVAGQGVFGAGVPANTNISVINTDGTTFSINNNATIASGATLTLTPAPSTYAPVNSDGGSHGWAVIARSVMSC
jgi:hypothetical protein